MMVRMQNARGMLPKLILQLIEEDNRICYINSDGLAEGSNVREAMKKYPDRIIDVGIAESNLIGIAAGMALSGKIPFVQAFGPFLSLRALEQIHTDIAYNDVPVRIIGTHGGTTSGGGPTHYTICDFGIMNVIPNMTMIAPADASQCLKAIKASLNYPGPIYFRIARGDEPAVYPEDTDYEYVIGKSISVRDGNDATIIGAGIGVYHGLQVSLILEQEGLRIRVIDMHTIKPLDKEAIIKAAIETGVIITVEDHNIEGGLGTLVSATIAEAGVVCKIKKLGVPDVFAVLGYPEAIYSYYGYDIEGIVKTLKAMI